MKTRRTIISALMAICAIGLSATTASAGKAVGGCPDSYQLVKASKFSTQSIDRNGDGYICFTTIPTPPPNTNLIDNNFPR
jgi:hypothetical protein